jgi:hypothetical protein
MAALLEYPDASVETTTCDGGAGHDNNTTAVWTTIQQATDGTHASDTATTIGDANMGMLGIRKRGSGNEGICRSHTGFDTSAISTDDIVAAIAVIYVTTTATSSGTSPNNIILTDSSGIASNTAVTTADYDQIGDSVGAPTKWSTGVAISGLSTSTYEEFSLNATGIAGIQKSGVTNIGWRHEADVTADANPATGIDYIVASSADETGTSQDPYLYVTHGASDDSVDAYYPDPDAETATVDGVTAHNNTTSNWDTAHDATTGTYSADTGATLELRMRLRGGGNYDIWRLVLTFNTGGIGATDVISAALLSTMGNTARSGDNDGQDYATVVQTQGLASDTAVGTADYDLVGDSIDDPTEGIDSGDRIDYNDISVIDFNEFSFNSTGIDWIARSGEQKPSGETAGITYLGLREGHDVEDNAVTDYNYYVFYAADETGTTKDPVLVVSYGAAAAADNALAWCNF